MIHPEDFIDANTRHWKDAELLFEQDHLANADYLYGLSAECGLKAVMIDLKPKTDKSNPLKKNEYRKHGHELWNFFITWAGKQEGRIVYLDKLPSNSPFRNWSHHNRYANRNKFSRSCVGLHSEAARKVHDMVKYAQMQGEMQS